MGDESMVISNRGANTSTLNQSRIGVTGGMTADELERLRKENAELQEMIRRYKESGLMVPGNKTGCCVIF